MKDVTYLINAIEKGDPHAIDELLPLVYQELRFLAVQKLSEESPGQTLQATALVHEAYLRLVGQEQQSWSSRGHFFSAAAEAMRRILIDNARRKKSLKCGGGRKRVSLTKAQLKSNSITDSEDLLALDEALEKFSKKDKNKANLVKLRYFAGLTMDQVSKILNISHSTADEHWAYAKAWLHHEMTKGNETT